MFPDRRRLVAALGIGFTLVDNPFAHTDAFERAQQIADHLRLQKRFRTQAEAKMAVFDFIRGFYNPRRRHSSLGQRSPVNFEESRGAAA